MHTLYTNTSNSYIHFIPIHPILANIKGILYRPIHSIHTCILHLYIQYLHTFKAYFIHPYIQFIHTFYTHTSNTYIRSRHTLYTHTSDSHNRTLTPVHHLLRTHHTELIFKLNSTRLVGRRQWDQIVRLFVQHWAI